MNELDLFVAAIAVADPADRIAFLDRECAGRPALRHRLDALLAGSEQSCHPLDDGPAPAVSPDATAPLGPAPARPPADFTSQGEETGAVVGGRYKLVERVGEGGMGWVWMAEQTEPVKRKVAVKLIKPGLDSKQVLARFEAGRWHLAAPTGCMWAAMVG